MIRLKTKKQQKLSTCSQIKFLKTADLNKQSYLVLFFPKKESIEILRLSNYLEIQTALYRIFKCLQVLKSGKFYCFFSESTCFLVQQSLLLTSGIEQKKLKKLKKLKEKLVKLSEKSKSKFVSPYGDRKIIFFRNFKSFLAHKNSQLQIGEKKVNILRFLKIRRTPRSKAIFERRLLIHRFICQRALRFYGSLNLLQPRLKQSKAVQTLGKRSKRKQVSIKKSLRRRKKKKFLLQKFKKKRFLLRKNLKLYTFLRRNKKSFTDLLGFYSRFRQKFRYLRKKKKKVFQRLIRKQGRKKKWKRRGVFRLFHKFLRFRNRFYIPKHFEINYKTGEILYLGFLDSRNLSLRLPFPLNLRRLYTFLSF